MSDVEGDVAVQPEAAGPMDLNTALQEVLKTAAIHDGVARGLNEAARALDKRQAHLCLLAKNCDQPDYVRLIEALCSEHNIPLLKVDDNKKLGKNFYMFAIKLMYFKCLSELLCHPLVTCELSLSSCAKLEILGLL